VADFPSAIGTVTPNFPSYTGSNYEYALSLNGTADLWTNRNNAPILYRQVLGASNWTLEAEIKVGPASIPQNFVGGLVVYPNTDGATVPMHVGWTYWSGNKPTFEATGAVGTYGTGATDMGSAFSSAPTVGTDYVGIRLIKTGNVFTGQYKFPLTTGSWTNFGSNANFTWTTLPSTFRVGLLTKSGSSAAYQANFRNVTFCNLVTSNGLQIRLDATTYSGSGTWSNTGALGTNFNATIENGTPSKNAANNGVVFNGATNFTFSNPVLGNAWTASSWVKRTGTNGASAAYLTQTGAGGGILNLSVFTNDSGAGVGSNQVAGGFYTGATWKNTTPFTLDQGTWYNLTYAWDGTTLVSYVNGVSTATLAAGVASSNNGNAYRIGRRWDTASYIVGEIGQMLVYNRGLTPAEVLQNYNATSTTFAV
jgi:hypothetical protein